ncbi:phosphatase PAP2 family protein [Blastococcus goldschmidtiae]|uniref:Phosphatase PAP2 family protein n=1 Tax=Blastococcus goldschmidtiae TaxID=3075546 RepID=A0ABU2K8K0_9ACTN|nr:phosphatase PAP2 family protein [Blastococcus sp. DSM 46792]MDT0276520.1 phosphatase PAP2 family protein [Blastococcus sp. DSM 46792]
MTATLVPTGAGAPTPSGPVAVTARPTAGSALLRSFSRPVWWVEVLLLAVLYGVYSLVRNSVGDVVGRAYANGRDILALEDGWALALERGLNDWVHRTDVVAGAVALHYATLHFLVTPAVLTWLFLRRPSRYRAASGVLMITTALALIGFYWLPTAPPRLLGDEGFVDVMSQTSSWGWWPASGTPGSDAISNQFAAMPSLHCAWAAWCGVVLLLLVRRTWVRVVALAYPFSTFFVVMGSGNHYLLDVVAGVVVLCLGAVVVHLAATAAGRSPEAGPVPADTARPAHG